jgi:hypothetical protein
VFVLYVPDVESMLKPALYGSAKDTVILQQALQIISSTISTWLTRRLYQTFSEPTNDIYELLERVDGL